MTTRQSESNQVNGHYYQQPGQITKRAKQSEQSTGGPDSVGDFEFYKRMYENEQNIS